MDPQRPVRDELNQLTYAVIGAAIEVHRVLGPGFLESVYQRAMELELASRRIRFDRQLLVPVEYKNCVIAEHVLDLVIEGQLVVELKAIESILPVHHAQLLSYLKAGAFELGLIVNFHSAVLKNGVKRIVRSIDGGL